LAEVIFFASYYRYSGKHCSDSGAVSFFPSLSRRGAAGSDSRAVSISLLTRFGAPVRDTVDSDSRAVSFFLCFLALYLSLDAFRSTRSRRGRLRIIEGWGKIPREMRV